MYKLPKLHQTIRDLADVYGLTITSNYHQISEQQLISLEIYFTSRVIGRDFIKELPKNYMLDNLMGKICFTYYEYI